MKVFLAGCASAIAIAVVAAIVLQNYVDQPSSAAYTTSSTRAN
jgi:hypothetical protein